jgi:hypothetical protein
MAAPWLALLQQVPWADVVGNAPKLAEGAKKLWQAVNRRPGAGDTTGTATAPDAVPPLAALQGAVADLQQQLAASSELIKALAEQNAELVQRHEAARRSLRWLAAATAAATLLALAALATAWLR